jgi:hypothetical protein
MYGWKVATSDIPNIEEHVYHEWEDIFEVGDTYGVVLNGHETTFSPWECVTGSNAYRPYDQQWYVGMPLHDGVEVSRFIEQINDADVCEIYRRVVGHEPKSNPTILSFMRWY